MTMKTTARSKRTSSSDISSPAISEFLVNLVHLIVPELLHQNIADESDDEKHGHQPHRHVVRLRLRNAGLDLMLPDVVHEHRPEHAGGRPRREKPSVDGADEARAEQIRHVR